MYLYKIPSFFSVLEDKSFQVLFDVNQRLLLRKLAKEKLLQCLATYISHIQFEEDWLPQVSGGLYMRIESEMWLCESGQRGYKVKTYTSISHASTRVWAEHLSSTKPAPWL